MKPFELLGHSVSPDGTVMKLTRRGNEYLILADGAILMTSRMHGSEEALATLTCQRLRTLKKPSVLIGGLGMGFTLRATLDLLPQDATVVVVELVPAVVEWNRGPLGPLAKHPLQDKRVQVETADVLVSLSSRRDQFDDYRQSTFSAWRFESSVALAVSSRGSRGGFGRDQFGSLCILDTIDLVADIKGPAFSSALRTAETRS